MATLEEKKAFSLEQIKPYVMDRSLCSRDENHGCQYYMKDGRMCVVGKNMIDPKKYLGDTTAIEFLMSDYNQGILKPESRNILTGSEWGYLQNIHDALAGASTFKDMHTLCENIGLFTYEELMQYENTSEETPDTQV